MPKFEPGRSGNPAGRPKGARSRLSEEFLDALAEDFTAHGAAAIVATRRERPAEYVKTIAGLLPKEERREIEGALTVTWLPPQS